MSFKHRIRSLGSFVFLAGLSACGGGGTTAPPLSTPLPTVLPTPGSTPSPLPTPSPSASPSPISTSTPTPTPSPGSVTSTLTVPMPVRTFTLASTSLKLLGVPITIAGQPTELLLDTGSAGLRVFANAVGSQGLERLGIPNQVQFGDGTVYIGELALASVQIGSATTTDRIIIQVVDEVTCIPSAPNCPGQTGFDNFNNAGFSGILGVSLNARTSDLQLYNPLAQLEGDLASGYIIETGGFNSTQGSFTLGLAPSNQQGFTTAGLPQVISTSTGQPAAFENGVPVWADAALQPFYTIDGLGPPLVNAQPANTLFDTGSSDLSIEINNPVSDTFVLISGSNIQVDLPSVFNFQLQVGFPITPSLDRVFVTSQPNEPLFQVLGMPFFFQFDTRFDVEQGTIGFRER